MSDTTSPNGFPYPEGTDSVNAYPALAQALAEAIDDHVALTKAGSLSSGTLVAATVKTVSHTFTTPFPAAGPVPQVIPGISGGQGTATVQVTVANVTRSGFDFLVMRTTGTGALTMSWIATNVGNW